MTGSRAAIILALCLLGAYCINLWLVHRDRVQRETLETVIEPSAVGDHAYVPLTDDPAAGAPVAQYQGEVLRAFDGEKVRAADAEMVRVGPEDSQTYSVYRPAPDTKDEDLKGFLFLKLGEGQYLKLKSGERETEE